MRLISLTPVRNEEWCIGYTLRSHLRWVDHAVVLDHASTDRTREIIQEIARESGGRVTILEEPDPSWDEMSHRHRLLLQARQLEGTHFAMLDADEVLSTSCEDMARDQAQRLRSGRVLLVPLHNCWRSVEQYRADRTPYGSGWASLVVAEHPHLAWIGDQFHHRHPFNSHPGPKLPTDRAEGGLLHLQHASWRRVRAKQALYKMVEVLRWCREPIQTVDHRYSRALDEHRIIHAATPPEWWPGDPSMIDLDAEPWQEQEIARLLKIHGREKFAGLDLFGLETRQ
jgi:hypothetical protein